MEQLLLVTSCDSPAGIGASLRTDERTDGWTHRRDVGNSILDLEPRGRGLSRTFIICNTFLKKAILLHIEATVRIFFGPSVVLVTTKEPYNKEQLLRPS